MRQNSLLVLRTRKHEVTTDSNHKFNIAPNLPDRDFVAVKPDQNGFKASISGMGNCYECERVYAA